MQYKSSPLLFKLFLFVPLIFCFSSISYSQNYDWSYGNVHEDLWRIVQENIINQYVVYNLGSSVNGFDFSTPMPLEYDTLREIFEYGARTKLNIFILFGYLAEMLEKVSIRVLISGDDLRRLDVIYEIAEARVQRLIPIPIIEYIELGSTLNEASAVLEIHIDPMGEKYKYTEIDELTFGFEIDNHYGFRKVDSTRFHDAYGIQVNWAIFNYALDRIVLNENDRIAVYAKNFFIAKRWWIKYITYDADKKE